MNRISLDRSFEFLGKSGLMAVLLTGVASVAQAQNTTGFERPNIIVYLADDVGVEAFGSYGGTSYETPNIDQLAAEGMRFTRAYSMPLCTPTRVAFLTGKYNFRNYDDFAYLHTAERTIANYLQAAGYATAIVGKWQLGGSFQTPHLFGFDEYLVWQLEAPDWWTRYKNPVLTHSGESTRRREGGYGPDLFAEFAMDFMERHRDQPFFIVFSDTLAHDPWQPTPDSPEYETLDEATVNDVKYFGDNIRYQDKLVGRLVGKLDSLGIGERTLVFFTSDNGTHSQVTSMTNRGPVLGDKGGSLDAAMHVPLIASWPGTIAPGQVRDDLVDTTDLFATIFEAGGVQINNVRYDGVSLYPTLTRATPSPREWIFVDYYRSRTPGPDTVRGGFGTPFRLVHDGRYKLHADGRFFDVVTDPREEHPLWENELSPDARNAHEVLQAVMMRMEAEVRLWDSRRDETPQQLVQPPPGMTANGGG
ncbi:MAG: sulfatase-like hydrolase/transferase [Rhodospirillaceae bacterium]|nr:sulfatase-like hydrolase/transferase [Rhodospirillaceae bacterium]